MKNDSAKDARDRRKERNAEAPDEFVRVCGSVAGAAENEQRNKRVDQGDQREQQTQVVEVVPGAADLFPAGRLLVSLPTVEEHHCDRRQSTQQRPHREGPRMCEGKYTGKEDEPRADHERADEGQAAAQHAQGTAAGHYRDSCHRILPLNSRMRWVHQ